LNLLQSIEIIANNLLVEISSFEERDGPNPVSDFDGFLEGHEDIAP
jgi:hypothetical protein